MYSDGMMKTVPLGESWRQTSMNNGAKEDRGRDGLTPSSTIWRNYDSWWRMPVWFTLLSNALGLNSSSSNTSTELRLMVEDAGIILNGEGERERLTLTRGAYTRKETETVVLGWQYGIINVSTR